MQLDPDTIVAALATLAAGFATGLRRGQSRAPVAAPSPAPKLAAAVLQPVEPDLDLWIMEELAHQFAREKLPGTPRHTLYHRRRAVQQRVHHRYLVAQHVEPENLRQRVEALVR